MTTTVWRWTTSRTRNALAIFYSRKKQNETYFWQSTSPLFYLQRKDSNYKHLICLKKDDASKVKPRFKGNGQDQNVCSQTTSWKK